MKTNINKSICYIVKPAKFFKIPGNPIAFWASANDTKLFQYDTFKKIGWASKGIITGNNAYFLHLWYEICLHDISFISNSLLEAVNSCKKWFPCNKGGEYRKWFGNNDFVIDWYNNGEEVMQRNKTKARNCQDYKDEYKFVAGITWTSISSEKSSFRLTQKALSESAGMTLFVDNDILLYSLSFLNSVVCVHLLSILNPTLNFTAGSISDLPLIANEEEKSIVDKTTEECIALERKDWDSFETSWDFKRHPLM